MKFKARELHALTNKDGNNNNKTSRGEKKRENRNGFKGYV